MRKMIIFLMSVCILFTFVFSAAADVIWEPYGDSFYDAHRDEIVYEGRTYKATRDLEFCKKPNGKTLSVDPIYADETFFVQYVYEDEDGVLWGNCSHRDADSVWVDLSGNIRPYDREDFREDYENTFEDLSAQPDAAFYADAEIGLYDYPGSEKPMHSLYVADDASYLPEYNHTYTDPNGNIWGETFYYMGQKGWVLLEGDITKAVKPDKAEDTLIPARADGTGADLPEDEDSTEEATVESDKNVSESSGNLQETTQSPDRNVIGADRLPQEDSANVLLPVLLVAAVVAVSLAVLFVFFRKKKKN